MFGIHPAILSGLGICMVLLIYTIWEEYVLKFVTRGVFGILVMWLGNMIVPSAYLLEWNFVHILIAVVFGIPGTIGMFLVRYFMT
ncbi:MAG: pro-sigmaK processing inhibitor BofA family protein [Cellulosilyticaceae bacterium]